MSKRIGEIDNDLLKTGGLIVGGFFLVRYMFKSLGIGTDPADLQTIQDAQTTDPVDNPFNANFQPAIDAYNQSSQIPIAQYYQTLKSHFDSGALTAQSNDYNIAVLAEALNNALTGFHLTGTDQAAVMAVFPQIVDQESLAAISAYLLYNFNEDLLTMLHGSIFNYGLTPSNLAIVIKNMNNLPQ